MADGVEPRLPEELRAFLDAGRPLALVGRWSTPSGPKAVQSAVEDFLTAVEVTERHTGLQIRDRLPSVEALVQQLAAQPTVSHPERGRDKPMRHRMLVLDLRAEAGMVALLITGSGAKVMPDGQQPVVLKLAEVVREYEAALLVRHREDRSARVKWALAPLADSLEQTGAFLASGEQPPQQFDDARSIIEFLRGGESAENAKNLFLQTRRGQRDLSEYEMRSGQAGYRMGTPVPPGLATCYLDDGTGGRGRRVLFLDTPACRPDPQQVTSGLPRVFDADGQPVDQVANVRWILERLGRPQWPMHRVLEGLTRRRYSTQHLREVRRDPAACYTLADHARYPGGYRHLLDSIMHNLEVYETGVLPRELHPELDTPDITGVMPPDGPWAQPEDFARIRRWRAENHDRRNRAVSLPLTGVEGTYNGEAVKLLTEHCPSRDIPPRYKFTLLAHYPDRALAPAGHVRIPWAVLHGILTDAIRDADGLPLRIVGLDDLGDADHAQRRAELDAAVAELDAARRDLERLEARLEDTDEHGAPRVTGALLDRLNTRYNTLAEQTIPDLERRAAQARAHLDQTLAPDPTLAGHDQLLHLVERLGDPADSTLNGLWKTSLCDLEITTTRLREGSARGWHVEVTATLRFTDGEHTYDIPVHGRWRTGAASRLPQRLDDLAQAHLERMRAGEPLPHPDAIRWRQVRPRLTQLLTSEGRPPLVMGCSDPTITAIATRLHLDPKQPDAALASELDVSPALVARIREIHLEPLARRNWRQPPPPGLRALYDLAVVNGGHVTAADAAERARVSAAQVYNLAAELRATTDLWTTHLKRGYQLRACSCGALDWTLPEIPEPLHAICRACRHDLAGLHWPADPYQRYEAGSGCTPPA
ncbi:hypothetical protein [Egibacter rhizosphaerae]|uniref:hypothetical protein n=1 Tax=Egibacter rhizosphaerae TaxID=1670831 RepID=UPI0013F16091|nr:hypothetical protein [Egibacter rhizosphaerae]